MQESATAGVPGIAAEEDTGEGSANTDAAKTALEEDTVPPAQPSPASPLYAAEEPDWGGPCAKQPCMEPPAQPLRKIEHKAERRASRGTKRDLRNILDHNLDWEARHSLSQLVRFQWDSPNPMQGLHWRPPAKWGDHGGKLTALQIGGWDVYKIREMIGYGFPPDMYADGRPMLVMDLHWERFIWEVMDPLGDLSNCDMDCELPTPGEMLADVVGTGAVEKKIKDGGYQTLGAWVLDLCWMEMRVRLGVSASSVAYNVGPNATYGELCHRIAGGAGQEVQDTCEVTAVAKLGNIVETWAGKQFCERNLHQIRNLLILMGYIMEDTCDALAKRDRNAEHGPADSTGPASTGPRTSKDSYNPPRSCDGTGKAFAQHGGHAAVESGATQRGKEATAEQGEDKDAGNGGYTGDEYKGWNPSSKDQWGPKHPKKVAWNKSHDSLISRLEWDFKQTGNEVASEYMENVKKRVWAGDLPNQIRWDHRQLLARWGWKTWPSTRTSSGACAASQGP
eukprot:GHVR01004130.1.p1 GENE.GHVR01004130.1~~GHVR01004130.1.p1  ORF type:complete len:507 (-),score=103.42 GHVR01004130.1:77-1597(-)